jgi:histidinol-phosphatase (PHP family)
MYDQFLQEAVRLQSKYHDKICLLIGLETEYFNRDSINLVRNLRQPRRQYRVKSASAFIDTSAETKAIELPQVQYIVGSLHHVHGIPLDFSQELYLKALEKVGKGSWEVLFREYFDAQFEMLQGLEPEVVGHLDLVRIFFGAIKGCHHSHSHGGSQSHDHAAEGQESTQNQNRLTDELWTLVKRNVDYVIGYGGLFELKSRAWKKGLADAYPQRDILEVSPINSRHHLLGRN